MKQLLAQISTRHGDSKGLAAWSSAIGGIALILLALIFIIGGTELGFGSLRRMGSGAFPIITGVVLIVLAIPITIMDIRKQRDARMGSAHSEETSTDNEIQNENQGNKDEDMQPDWISFLALGAALATFALTAERWGLVPAVLLCTVIASAPDRSLKFSGKLLLGAVVSLACWLLFIKALGLPFTAFKGF